MLRDQILREQMPAGRGTGSGDGGFTLLEAVVALGIVAMVVTAYLGIRTSALADGIEARNWRLAREIAEERLSEVLAGAHETPPQSGISVSLDEKYPGFSYQIVIGESAVAEMEAGLASDAAEQDPSTRDRSDWQQNRDLYRKASARGLSALEYQDQTAAEEYQRQISSKAPSEDDFEEIAVVVFFPKLEARYDGQRESFVIKSKVSTLALSGLTPDQARQIAEAQGGGDPATSSSGSAGGSTGGSTGGSARGSAGGSAGGASGNPFAQGGK
jgi:type II secretory pathway pseudopilin PulG